MAIIAYRRWRLDRDDPHGGLLRPLAYGPVDIWAPPATPATADEAPEMVWDETRKRWPSFGHGFYAYKTPIAQCACIQPDGPQHGAVGVVKLWGAIVEHQFGYRAHHAEPVALVTFGNKIHPGYGRIPRFETLADMYDVWAIAPAEDHREPLWCYSHWFGPLARVFLASQPPTRPASSGGVS